ncbi:alpha-amylase family glycosyl hydrolase [Halobacillus sp. H74]|uniref:alpha-amylase family glycosyl hydrolase n=1 Tax=Halobacillus sp. H74 TaxID=3457436 RepID=UPI003FCDA559
MRKSVIGLMVIPFFLLCSFSVSAAEREERQWQDESIYYIMIDRFMNGEMGNNEGANLEDPEAYHGGDIKGIIEQLDYIKELGFTTIQLSPIMANEDEGFHGFRISDFQSVEEHFGTIAQAQTLVEEAHARDLKVIFDLPVGFTGENHSWLDEQSKGDWFAEGQVASELSWIDGMPKLDTSNTNLQQYFQETMDFWQQETGVDGFRLVSSSQVPEELLQTASGDRIIIAENLSDKETFRTQSREIFSEAGNPLDELVTQQSVEEVNRLDGFGVGRFTHLAVENGQNPITRWQLALTYLFTAPGIPQLYYGSEIPLDDGGNLHNLPMMNFKAGDEKLRKRVEKLTSMREQFPALTRGNYEELYNQEGLAVFKRTEQEQTMIVAINNAEETKTMEIENLEDDHQLRGLLHDGLVRQQNDGSYRLGMERETADVFIVEQNSGYNWMFIGFVGGVLGLFVLAVIMISLKNRKEKS